MDFRYSPEQDAFRARLREWLEENVPEMPPEASVAGSEAEVSMLREWQRRLFEAGWCGLSWPKEYGGQGASFVEEAIYSEEMARAQAPELINRVGVDNVGPTLIRHGTEEQKRRFLSKILSAAEIWCQLFSEPGAGSDLASLRTRAEADGDGFRLTGQKVWSSYAHFSRWAICLARTSPDAPKHQGITYFIVDMEAGGIEIRPLRQMTGSAEFNEVFLENVFVPRDLVIGEIDDGWNVAMSTLAHERGTGYLFKEQVKARILVDRLCSLIRERAEEGRPVHPSVRHAAVDAWIRTEILRLFNLDTITRLESGEHPGAESSLKKEFWTRLVQDANETMMAAEGLDSQLMTGDPRAVDHGRWQQTFLYSRSHSISAGSSEIQKNIIATRLLHLPK